MSCHKYESLHILPILIKTIHKSESLGPVNLLIRRSNSSMAKRPKLCDNISSITSTTGTGSLAPDLMVNSSCGDDDSYAHTEFNHNFVESASSSAYNSQKNKNNLNKSDQLSQASGNSSFFGEDLEPEAALASMKSNIIETYQHLFNSYKSLSDGYSNYFSKIDFNLRKILDPNFEFLIRTSKTIRNTFATIFSNLLDDENMVKNCIICFLHKELATLADKYFTKIKLYCVSLFEFFHQICDAKISDPTLNDLLKEYNFAEMLLLPYLVIFNDI